MYKTLQKIKQHFGELQDMLLAIYSIFTVLKPNVLRFCIIIFVLVFYNCQEARYEDPYHWETIEVTASAYNSTRHQTDSNPFITAFGDSLKPGLNYIAVSKDLLKKG